MDHFGALGAFVQAAQTRSFTEAGRRTGVSSSAVSKAVAKAHGLTKNEELLGWLYVGGKPTRSRPLRGKEIDPTTFVSSMPGKKRSR